MPEFLRVRKIRILFVFTFLAFLELSDKKLDIDVKQFTSNLNIYATLGYIVSLILLNLGHVFAFFFIPVEKDSA